MTSEQKGLLEQEPSTGIKTPCVAVSTSDITLSGEQTIDSVSVVDGDRVLVSGQTTGSEDGIYVARSSAWERASDFDKSEDIANGVMVAVTGGSNAGIYQVTFSGTYTVGTTAPTITQIFTDPNLTYLVDTNNLSDVDTAATALSNIGGTAKSTLTTKGDIYAASAASTPARLAVGSDGQRLSASSGESTGLKWVSPGATRLIKSGNYTLVASDLGDRLIVWVDISGGSVDITELALGSMSGVVEVHLGTDAGQTSANKLRYKTSGGSEVWTGFRKGERIVCFYDGISRFVVEETVPPARVELYKTADLSVSPDSYGELYAANVSVDINHGTTWASSKYTTPFAGRCRMVNRILIDDDRIFPTYKINTTEQLAGDTGGDEKAAGGGLFEFDVSAGDDIVPSVFNDHGSNTNNVRGDAAKDETFTIIEMIERHR